MLRLILPLVLILAACAGPELEPPKDARVARDASLIDAQAAPRDAGPRDAGPDKRPPDQAQPDADTADAAPDAEAGEADAAPDAAPPTPDACAPAPETCNGLDDDCDGRIDEDPAGAPLSAPCFEGPQGTLGIGACRGGARRCQAGRFGPCEDQRLPAPETCDGTDEDCDGVIDEGDGGELLREACYSGPPETRAVGVCRGGERSCAAGTFGPCRGESTPTEEICDGLDNDCDGRIDEVTGGCRCAPDAERPCYGGPPGSEGVGPCRAGQQRCAADGSAWGPCLDAVLPQAETCDGTDDDCDGRIDEAVAGVGAPCAAGVGVCRAEGQTVCDDARGEVVCAAAPGAPAPERCNGLDDDCDGRTDEGLGLGANCAVGVGACRAEGLRICAPDGTVTCSATPGAPALETCSGRDDDCDGQIDEGFALGAPCAVGEGLCARDGLTVCQPDGAAGCDARPGAPSAERCNGQDDDCDGRVDEGAPEAGAPCASDGLGLCRPGRTACEGGALICTPTVNPAAEICDGVDNDCDGQVDEDPTGGPLRRNCYPAAPETLGVGPCRPGEQLCLGGAFAACQGAVLPRAELCDGVDNDCNGVVDDLPAGACVCEPGRERPCYPGPPETEGVGVCRGGTQRCREDGSGFGACAGAVAPGPERCTGLDDDCNGLVDDVQGLGAACAVGLGPCRAEGARRCVNGELACDARPAPPAEERCDGVDNDCNGAVDDVPGVGTLCEVGVGACLQIGRLRCGADPLPTCDAAPGAPSPETCNRLDDDCDGAVDEGLGGAPCAVGVGACRRAGQTACQGGVLGCGVSPGAPAPETCNGLDDDCDGTVDEDTAGLPCQAGVGDCARAGATTCLGGVAGCDAVPGAPGIEICGGGDEDCDGAVDEGLGCDPWPSCDAAFAAGLRADGVYQIQPVAAAQPRPVWCDQTTDGGGWTLVASTRGTTLDDAGGPWYPELSSLAPAGGQQTIWDGLRARADRFDLRFACRDHLGAAEDPLTVDLSFYDVGWYHEITTGADAESCFSEGNGYGVDLPPPARRDNLSGDQRALGDPWEAIGAFFQGDRYLEGEDSCAATDDFTVDFSDRGMDSEQSDGTDWGEDDSSRKCGRSGLATGQWFLYARERRDPSYTCPADDPFEPDDTPAQALPVRVGPSWWRILCGANRDWHRLEGVAGQCYRVDLRFRHAGGDLDLYAESSARAVLGRALSVTDNETLTITAPADGVILLEIRGYLLGAGGNAYTLELEGVPCP